MIRTSSASRLNTIILIPSIIFFETCNNGGQRQGSHASSITTTTSPPPSSSTCPRHLLQLRFFALLHLSHHLHRPSTVLQQWRLIIHHHARLHHYHLASSPTASPFVSNKQQPWRLQPRAHHGHPSSSSINSFSRQLSPPRPFLHLKAINSTHILHAATPRSSPASLDATISLSINHQPRTSHSTLKLECSFLQQHSSNGGSYGHHQAHGHSYAHASKGGRRK